MINVLALTQFAFLTLGVVSLKIMIHANSSHTVSPYLQNLNQISLWLFAVPLLWIAFASVCQHVNRAPLRPMVAQVIGVVLAIACFGFLASATFFF